MHQLRDIFRYRELIRLLTVTAVKLRYKGSFLGFLWSLINPLLLMVVFYFVFVVLLPNSAQQGCTEVVAPGASTKQVQDAISCKIYSHYLSFILIGILAWNFTASAVSVSLTSLLGNAAIIKKVYFPREVFPISAVLAQLVNFILALIPLFLVILLSGIQPGFYALLLPVVIFFHLLFLTGLALLFSVMTLYFRDLIVIMEVLLQAWFFVSPVIYSMQQVFKDGAQVVYWLNPMASFIETYRTILFFNYPPDFGFTLRTCLSGVVVFALGYGFFMWKRKQIGQLI